MHASFASTAAGAVPHGLVVFRVEEAASLEVQLTLDAPGASVAANAPAVVSVEANCDAGPGAQVDGLFDAECATASSVGGTCDNGEGAHCATCAAGAALCNDDAGSGQRCG